MRKSFLIAGVAAASLLAAGAVVAQSSDQSSAQSSPSDPHRGDADGDGRLSRAEFVDGRVARVTALDADRDGAVAVDEAAAGRQARRADRQTARFDRLDADSNGSISRAEFESARDGAHEGRRGQRMAHRMRERGPVTIEQAQTRATEAFARLDADSDGYLTVEERRAGREHRREARRAARPSLPASATE